ncbi:ClpP/crotonase [Rozella allomycis CSF55]|uniref:ClpP/crotonase n=1 Tax=Rozella allomycis (strain CSF55) TaxID=988480 RepID=A0A075AXA5_ROZAC|nr:hypothetical protein O9G_002018 [Rozella allomycis CSF55]RKP18602.1 ClpP/crotonase [Rozella allomycis CSF55]|eukprot:EPZ34887.1 hypothetical protein O9G_002018 [Rozella allomycis CSF55]
MALPTIFGIELNNHENGILEATFNRPNELNSFNRELYESLLTVLSLAKELSTVKVLVLTGNDAVGLTLDKLQDDGEITKNCIDAFIDFPKVLIVGWNGPAIGVSVTISLLNSAELKELKIVSHVYKKDEFRMKLLKFSEGYAKVPPVAFETSKKLLRDTIREDLHKANKLEMRLLIERMNSFESKLLIMNFCN